MSGTGDDTAAMGIDTVVDVKDAGDDPIEPAGKLPSGRHGLSRRFVERHQRERLLAAMVAVVARKGYVETTVADVLSASGISRKTFYEQFSGKDDCFLQAYDALLEDLDRSVAAHTRSEMSWPQRVRAALLALLTWLAVNPDGARVGLIEVASAGPEALERYDHAVRRFVPILDAGREESPYAHQLSDHLSEAVAGGIAQVLQLRLISDEASALPDCLDDLLHFALVPYIGHAAAERIASQTAAAGAA